MPITKTKALYSGISQKWPPWGPRLKTKGDYSRENKTKVNVYVVVQFFPWFKFYFPLFKTHYHILPYPKTKENKI